MIAVLVGLATFAIAAGVSTYTGRQHKLVVAALLGVVLIAAAVLLVTRLSDEVFWAALIGGMLGSGLASDRLRRRPATR